MNPTGTNESGLNLPPPVEQNPLAVATPEAAPLAVEQQPNPVPSAVATAAVPPTFAIPEPQNVPTSTSSTDVSATTSTVVPTALDDGDLIEKEWVNKAKAIVEATREDPYQQSEQLTVFKADYMKKRYDKTIKVSK